MTDAAIQHVTLCALQCAWRPGDSPHCYGSCLFPNQVMIRLQGATSSSVFTLVNALFFSWAAVTVAAMNTDVHTLCTDILEQDMQDTVMGLDRDPGL